MAAAVTSPPLVMLATVALLLDHVTARPLNALCSESSVVAVNCTERPTSTLAAVGLTLTCATGANVTETMAVSVAAPGCPRAMTLIRPVSDAAL